VETVYICSSRRPILPLERLMTMRPATPKDFEEALQKTRESQPSDAIYTKLYQEGWVVVKSSSDWGRALPPEGFIPSGGYSACPSGQEERAIPS